MNYSDILRAQLKKRGPLYAAYRKIFIEDNLDEFLTVVEDDLGGEFYLDGASTGLHCEKYQALAAQAEPDKANEINENISEFSRKAIYEDGYREGFANAESIAQSELDKDEITDAEIEAGIAADNAIRRVFVSGKRVASQRDIIIEIIRAAKKARGAA